MPDLSRRQVLQGLGAASTAALASLAIPAYGRRSKKALAVPDPHSLYLIFPGSWLFCFEDGMINAVTTEFKDHTYDLGVSFPQGQPRMPIEKGQTYTVDVVGYSPSSSIQDLVQPMKAASQGLIFAGVQRKQPYPSGLRTISLPMPSSISTAALIGGVTINVDPSLTQIPNITAWPAALALVYSGGWTAASIKSSDNTQPVVSLNSASPTHISFRTCQTSKCNMPLNCAIDCAEIKADVTHAKLVFSSMMAMLNLNGKSDPSLKFPDCSPGLGGAGGTWGVSIDRGSDTNIDPSEVGMPVECGQFANLHNCAAGAVIAGA